MFYFSTYISNMYMLSCVNIIYNNNMLNKLICFVCVDNTAFKAVQLLTDANFLNLAPLINSKLCWSDR